MSLDSDACYACDQVRFLNGRLEPAVALQAQDEEALTTVRGIWSVLQPGLNQQLDGDRRQRLWNELTSLLPDILPGLGLTGWITL